MNRPRYRNEYVKDWSERAASVRFSLEREERHAYDAVATQASPAPLTEGDVVEMKACKTWIENGDDYGTTGRWHLTKSSHDKLDRLDGYYCLIVYSLIEIEGKRVLIERIGIFTVNEITRILMENDRVNGDNAMKLPHTDVFK